MESSNPPPDEPTPEPTPAPTPLPEAVVWSHTLHAAEGPGAPQSAPEFAACPPRWLPLQTRFAAVTACAGIDALHGVLIPGFRATGQAWGDADGDGRLDLYVTDGFGPNALLRNLGSGRFEPVGGPTVPDFPSAGATFIDYDRDGDADLFVANLGPNALFRNDGNAWTDVAAEQGLAGDDESYTGLWGDYDGDGWLDLYVANYCTASCEFADSVGLDRLFHNEGDGTFTDASDSIDPLARSGLALGALWFDLQLT